MKQKLKEVGTKTEQEMYICHGLNPCCISPILPFFEEPCELMRKDLQLRISQPNHECQMVNHK